jgi:hypothetical protein
MVEINGRLRLPAVPAGAADQQPIIRPQHPVAESFLSIW